MSYPSEWHGSTDPEDKTGEAQYKLDGVDYCLRLESFQDYQMINKMLDVAFIHGKRFAGDAMRSHVINAVEKARADHAL